MNVNLIKNYVKLKGFYGIVMTSEKNNILGFNQYTKSDKMPYIIYADIESLIKKKRWMCKRLYEKVLWIFKWIFEKAQKIYNLFWKEKALPLTKEERKSRQDAKLCYICGKRILKELSRSMHHRKKS